MSQPTIEINGVIYKGQEALDLMAEMDEAREDLSPEEIQKENQDALAVEDAIERHREERGNIINIILG